MTIPLSTICKHPQRLAAVKNLGGEGDTTNNPDERKKIQ
jgi:hypothetical protein